MTRINVFCCDGALILISIIKNIFFFCHRYKGKQDLFATGFQTYGTGHINLATFINKGLKRA